MACRLLLIAVILTTMFAGCSSQKPAPLEWKNFSHADGRFSVMMPGTPEQSSYDMPIPSGTMKFISSMVDLPDQAKVFAVIYVDYPPGPADGDEVTAHKVIEKYVAGAAKKRKAEMQQNSKIKLGNYPGQEYLFTIPENGDKSMWRLCFVQNRLYQLFFTWSPKRGDSSAEAERFLNSFKVAD